MNVRGPRTSPRDVSQWWFNSGGVIALIAGLVGIGILVAASMAGLIGTPKAHNPASCLIVTCFIYAGAFAGLAIGSAVSIQFSPISYKDDFEENAATERFKASDRINGIFIGIFLSCIVVYLIFFLIAIMKFEPPETPHLSMWEDFPINPVVFLITILTLLFQSFFVARYASFTKMLSLFEALLNERDRLANLNIKVEKDGIKSDHFWENAKRISQLNSKIKTIRGPIFRDEQLYEPAGNIFVTMGIAATFIGLAFGLVSLDFESLADGDLGALSSFVGCMGLALGMSMLGVLTSMCSQWLRGRVSSQSTDTLLARADWDGSSGHNATTLVVVSPGGSGDAE